MPPLPAPPDRLRTAARLGVSRNPAFELVYVVPAEVAGQADRRRARRERIIGEEVRRDVRAGTVQPGCGPLGGDSGDRGGQVGTGCGCGRSGFDDQVDVQLVGEHAESTEQPA
ncbi:hypothetical protein [Micromonospora sp. LOL_023]|uniref:hypothetical protein n=1 Tax=Micromonospora sp. LOL_023 TaxID=3345418 RepID=UPI003A8C75AF